MISTPLKELWYFAGFTYSVSSVATGHLYCAVENKQISAYCRTKRKKMNE